MNLCKGGSYWTLNYSVLVSIITWKILYIWIYFVQTFLLWRCSVQTYLIHLPAIVQRRMPNKTLYIQYTSRLRALYELYWIREHEKNIAFKWMVAINFPKGKHIFSLKILIVWEVFFLFKINGSIYIFLWIFFLKSPY